MEDGMEVPYVIEQPSDRLELAPGEVAIVFPDMHVRVLLRSLVW